MSTYVMTRLNGYSIQKTKVTVYTLTVAVDKSSLSDKMEQKLETSEQTSKQTKCRQASRQLYGEKCRQTMDKNTGNQLVHKIPIHNEFIKLIHGNLPQELHNSHCLQRMD